MLGRLILSAPPDAAAGLASSRETPWRKIQNCHRTIAMVTCHGLVGSRSWYGNARRPCGGTPACRNQPVGGWRIGVPRRGLDARPSA